MPFFIYAKVTDGTASDVAELMDMISNVDVNFGEMYLDKGYLSRANAYSGHWGSSLHSNKK
jgi:hypothetical protein